MTASRIASRMLNERRDAHKEDAVGVRIWTCITVFVFMTAVSWAQEPGGGLSVVYLKNGKMVEGVIREQNDRMVKIEVNGAPVVYFLSEIGKIEAKKAPVFDPKTAPKDELIKYLINGGRSGSRLAEIIDEATASLSPEQAQEVRNLVDENVITLRIIKVYEKYFTEDELRQIVGFYEQDSGKKLLTSMPAILEESMGIILNEIVSKISK